MTYAWHMATTLSPYFENEVLQQLKNLRSFN